MGTQQRISEACNIQFYQTLKSKARIKVHQGGTRSGKTYAICQYLVYKLTTEKDPLVISIVRKTLPALKGSVQRDLIGIMQRLGVYYLGVHNKAENTFKYNGHTIEFLSVDEPQKIRGRKRDICFINEANELHYEDYRQLNMRTTQEIIIDFNPSDPVHWLYSELIDSERDDIETWVTTYTDNKFLSPELVREIELLKTKDPDYWRVFGEGQRAVFSNRQIFNNWEYIPYADFPDLDYHLGLDFGFSNDPTAILKVAKKNDKLYVHELLYKTGLTNRDIAEYLKAQGLNQTLMFCDSAEPKSIEELRQMDCMAKPAIKGAGSITAGISLIKEFDVIVSQESKNLIQEQRTYFWQQLKDGTIINTPIDKNNHLADALRYATYSMYKNRNDFFVI
jgi:phage terminase large subunit